MKKISESKTAFLPSVVLHRNDVEDITAILSECKEVSFKSGEYEYETLEELIRDKGNKLTDLTISGIEPFITLSLKRTFWPGGIFLYSSDGDNLAFFKIKEILLRNKRWATIWLLPILLTVILISYFFLIKFSPLPISNIKYAYIHTFVFIFLIPSIAMTRIASFPIIYLLREHEQKSFFQRNLDNIVVSLISALLSAIITYISTMHDCP
jgi:hypothetical protein